MPDERLPQFSEILKHHPAPWHWRDSYDWHDDGDVFVTESDNRREGRIKLVDANGKTVLEQWADYAGDAGLTIKEDAAKLIVAAVNAYAGAQEYGVLVECGSCLASLYGRSIPVTFVETWIAAHQGAHPGHMIFTSAVTAHE